MAGLFLGRGSACNWCGDESSFSSSGSSASGSIASGIIGNACCAAMPRAFDLVFDGYVNLAERQSGFTCIADSAYDWINTETILRGTFGLDYVPLDYSSGDIIAAWRGGTMPAGMDVLIGNCTVQTLASDQPLFTLQLYSPFPHTTCDWRLARHWVPAYTTPQNSTPHYRTATYPIQNAQFNFTGKLIGNVAEDGCFGPLRGPYNLGPPRSYIYTDLETTCYPTCDRANYTRTKFVGAFEVSQQ